MGTRNAGILAAVLLAGPCAAAEEPAPAGDGNDTGGDSPVSLVFEVDITSLPPEVLQTWLIYTAVLAADARSQAGGAADPVRTSDYDMEYRARAALASTWRDKRAVKGTPADPYLDKLLEIEAAGFLDEYVIATFAQPGWTIPGATLATLDFPAAGDWFDAHAPGFATPRFAHVEPAVGRVARPVPGAGLPDDTTLSPGALPCEQAAPRLAEAVAAWDAEARALTALPLAVDSGQQFIPLLHNLAKMEPWRSAGVTWVAPRAGNLAFIAGYCAVEDEDYSLAEGYLRRATTMLPLVPTIRLELVHVLTARRKLDEADRELDAVMAFVADDCGRALAWRKRGYLRIDQGRLEEAREAYKRSLEFEPGNPIALAELQVIEQEVVKAGGRRDPYIPPPAGPQVTSNCRGP